MPRKELSVTPRDVLGKKVATLRRSGYLPANIYGHRLESLAVQVEIDVLEKTMRASSANEVIDLKVEGETAARPVVVHKVQRHPLTSGPLHADFYQVSLREKMRAAVPLVIIGRSEAVETYNAVLVTALDTLNIEALPLDFPSHIEVDITALQELESSIHVRDLSVPGNITVLNDEDILVVKAEAPRIAEEIAAEAEEAAAAAAEEAAEAGEEAPEAEAEAEAETKAEGEEEPQAEA
jgi:large subunit ribosomal protein L25